MRWATGRSTRPRRPEPGGSAGAARRARPTRGRRSPPIPRGARAPSGTRPYRVQAVAVLPEPFDHPRELLAAVAVVPGELDELTCSAEDHAALRSPRDAHAVSAAELEQPFVAELA